MKKHLTKRDLAMLFDRAKRNYVTMAHGGLSDQEFQSMCWIIALSEIFTQVTEVEFPRMGVTPKEIK